MITGLAHVCFTVRDLDASIDFYQNKLGLQPAFDYRNEQGERYGIYLHLGQRSFVELFQGEDGPSEPHTSYRHFCLEVDDMEATVAQLRANGVEVGGTTRGKDRSWQAWLSDPDGNRIELQQYTAESKQMAALK